MLPPPLLRRLLRARPQPRSQPGPDKPAVARTALMNFLSSNPDLFAACVDRCYDPDPAVATGYFQVGWRQWRQWLAALCAVAASLLAHGWW
jgi:hypothetical protein